MKKYSVKELSKLAGVSIRTLHYYDKIGLLKPAIRTEAKYRLYGEYELLKLQQILFYKELDFSLKYIVDVFSDPDFDLIEALDSHKKSLLVKQKRITTMLDTIEKTMLNLKKKKMITDNELYQGFSKNEAKKMRNEAIDKFGKDTIEISETYLKKLSKEQFEQLKEDYKQVFKNLFNLSKNQPESETVQLEIARHYSFTRKFWGTEGSSTSQANAYKGLGVLYEKDERFTMMDEKPQPEFAKFLLKAMTYFADTQLV
ncbi:MerR family transcriptional regulator [Flavivirga eckloniae]|uniref:MerR family transcriptional regulator n=1 Tax=Flavivirga eckloniae TaxID=1803846 RepID=A0A2K9PV52_9FLAO|nr:MerR family transcriptional regulator [Flavivirga eckloniae]AUP80956.1 MerR family transcriptional regulator [Flavivirga eckloniae]